jgi:hypothetical protein
MSQEAILDFELTKLSRVNQEIQNHPAWVGHIPGLKAEKMLRGLKIPYLYVLRAGEQAENDEENHATYYYVTFIHSDGHVRHQPFVVTMTAEGWCWENYCPGGPCAEHELFNDVALHRIMHCNEGECTPYLFGKE